MALTSLDRPCTHPAGHRWVRNGMGPGYVGPVQTWLCTRCGKRTRVPPPVREAEKAPA